MSGPPASPLDPDQLHTLVGSTAFGPGEIELAEGLVGEALNRDLWLPGDDDDPWVDELEVLRMPPLASCDPVIGSWDEPPLGYDPVGFGALVYPRSTPVMSVTADQGASLRDSQSVVVSSAVGTVVQLSYKGGWTAATVPWAVKLLIARISLAFTQLGSQSTTTQVVTELSLVGASSVKVGDVAVTLRDPSTATTATSGAAAVIDSLVPNGCSTIGRLRHRTAA